VIAKIKKYSGASSLIRYLLKPTKQAQIVSSSMYAPAINQAIGREIVIESNDFKTVLAREITTAFDLVNSLNPRLGKNTMHLTIGFDPDDGKLDNEFKGEIAKELMQRMGFGDTYWLAVAHHRDDPEHPSVHQHDHIHIVSSRVNSDGRTISDRWDYQKANTILRQLEREYQLQPFIPFWERQYLSELYWMMNVHEEESFDLIEEKQSKTKTMSR
jgi:Relaxase/Mobilisation nuclease domain